MPTEKTVVWMSKHNPTSSQRAALCTLFPGHKLHIDNQSFSGADDIVKRYFDVGGSEMVVVAPWTVMRELIRLGIKPIYAEMKSVPLTSPEAEVKVGGRKPRAFKFQRFHRLLNINLELEELSPPQENKNGNSNTATHETV